MTAGEGDSARRPGGGEGRGEADGGAVALGPDRILDFLPQAEPFRFVDEIVEIDADHVVARYRFRPDADFYRGHFPGNPVTPGVILLESMAQVAVVALGIHLLALQGGLELVRSRIALFTDAKVEFGGLVEPGARVTIRARKLFFRRMKIRSEAEMHLDDGTQVCSATVSGMAVPR